MHMRTSHTSIQLARVRRLPRASVQNAPRQTAHRGGTARCTAAAPPAEPTMPLALFFLGAALYG